MSNNSKVVVHKSKIGKVMNHEYYSTELSYIKWDELRDRVIHILDYDVHSDNMQLPASSTGKHHPPFSNKSHGLVAHTRALVKVLVDVLFIMDDTMDNITRDCIIAAGILHDGAKYNGTSKWTNSNHASDMASIIRSSLTSDDSIELRDAINRVANIVNVHMGIFNDHSINDMDRPSLYVIIADMVVSRNWYGSNNIFLP